MLNCRLPRGLTVWLINHVCWKKRALVVGGWTIRIKSVIKRLLGIPDGPFPLPMSRSNRGSNVILRYNDLILRYNDLNPRRHNPVVVEEVRSVLCSNRETNVTYIVYSLLSALCICLSYVNFVNYLHMLYLCASLISTLLEDDICYQFVFSN
jgi:hypothetical protein